MAKKKAAAKKAPPRKRAANRKPALPASTECLKADLANPRSISDRAKEALRASLEKFGDLSGITFNLRTGELVGGHQRMEQLRELYGERAIRVVDAEAGLGLIDLEPGKAFPVRLVDWSRADQRLANVAANNAKMQGAFVEADLASYLAEVEEELTAEDPAVFDDLLIDFAAPAAAAIEDGIGTELDCTPLDTVVRIGPYRFKVSLPEFEAWEVEVKKQVGPTKEAICGLIAARLCLSGD